MAERVAGTYAQSRHMGEGISGCEIWSTATSGPTLTLIAIAFILMTSAYFVTARFT
jgi:hypothetical protein